MGNTQKAIRIFGISAAILALFALLVIGGIKINSSTDTKYYSSMVADEVGHLMSVRCYYIGNRRAFGPSFTNDQVVAMGSNGDGRLLIEYTVGQGTKSEWFDLKDQFCKFYSRNERSR